MWDAVLRVVHRDCDPVELTDPRHYRIVAAGADALFNESATTPPAPSVGMRNVRFRPYPTLRKLRTVATSSSSFAGDGDLEGFADLTHSAIAQSPEALDKCSERHALDRVEVDDRGPRDRILTRPA